jgi:hypothetical protein
MHRVSFLTGLLLIGFGTIASADNTADLIQRDKEWGAAGTKGDSQAAAKFLADRLISVSNKGVTDKKGDLAATQPAPEGTQYEPTDYKVVFLDEDTAVMTHSTKGSDAHYSLHVWTRISGQWQVVATSTTPAEKQ